MQTKKTLCIIDSDICFSSLLISRLQKYLPDIVAFQISRNIFEERPSLLLDNHFVLYNQNEISEEQLIKRCSPTRIPVLIPLLRSTPPHQPKDVLMLVHEVEAKCGLGRIPPSPNSSVQTCLVLSFVSKEEREKHVIRQIKQSRRHFKNIIRLDVMPGILMAEDPEVYTPSEKNRRTEGISELLNRLRLRAVSFSDIPGYLEPDPYGDLRFGKPLHSDDIIRAHSHTLLTLISRTVRYLNDLHEPSLLIVVADGLSFTRMRTLCRNLSHLEILTPFYLEKDYMLCDEIDQLQKAHDGTSHLDYPYEIPKNPFHSGTRKERSMTLSRSS